MKYLMCVFAALGLLGAIASCTTEPPRQPTAGNYGTDSLWDDGREEISSYVGTDESGLQTRPLTARMAVVVHGDTRQIARENRHESFSLLFSLTSPAKGVLDSTVRAAVFPRQDLSRGEITAIHFGARDTIVAAVHPMVGGGIRIAWTRDPRQAIRIHGPWPAAVGLKWPSSDRPHVCYDALPLWLRQWVGEKPPWEMQIWLLPSLVGDLKSLRRARPVDATVRVVDGDMLQVPAGRFRAVEVLVAAGGKADVFWFDATYPHVLLKIETYPRTTLELQRSERVAGGQASRF